MTKQAGPLPVLRDALARHGGARALARRLLLIAKQEGLRGLAHRGMQHGRRLYARAEAGMPDLKAPLSPPPTIQPQPSNALPRELQPGLSLIGHPYAVLGRAEDVRTAACACAAADIPFEIVNLHGDHDRANAARHRDFPHFDRVVPGTGRRANLMMLNADEMHHLASLDATALRDTYNIGCFAWELSRFPAAYADSLAGLHEVWAPTRFIQQAIADTTSLPVILMPFAVEPGPAPSTNRAAWGMAEDAFVFLFFFDFRSYVQRKNPWAVLEAFHQAFGQHDTARVQLLIKVIGFEQRPEQYEALRGSELAQDPRVRIIDEVLDDKGIKSLVASCDSFVSLHRSEGFGRGLAEAMYYGKPVIATGYSGNVDFMHPGTACLVNYTLIPVGADDYPHGAGQVWADADVEQAAWFMRKLVADPAYARSVGAAASAYVKEFHSYDAVGRQYRRRLDRLGLLS